jgi:hypothetical protein
VTNSFLSAQTLHRTLVAAAAFVVLAGFSRPTRLNPVTAAPSQPGAFTVQVRDFPSSSTVEIVGWAAPSFGLRTSVPRKGGAWRYHWLYVSTTSVTESANITKAQGMSRSLPLDLNVRDDQNCLGDRCSPPAVFRARITDDVLRSNKDKVAVSFFTASGAELPFAVRRDLVDAYLTTVDSVRAALAKP